MPPKSFVVDHFMEDYFTKGFYVFSGELYLRQIPIDYFKVVKEKHEDNCFHAEGHEFHSLQQTTAIEMLKLAISSEWLSKIDNHATSFDFYTDSVNDHVRKFHSDAEYNMAGQNATVNCFFDDMGPDVGGSFQMRPYTKEEPIWPVVECYFPKKYDIVIFNQNRNFQHRAEPATVKRRMLSYACAFANINPILPNFTPG